MQRWKRVATATAVLTGSVMAAITLVTTAAGGAVPPQAAPKVEHCVVRVVTKAADGQLITTDPVCAPTRAAAMGRSGATAAADFPIGVHFDGPGYTGASFTVVGADCTGGWLNLPAVWVNRVSSTMNGCPRIRHYDGFNLTGSAEDTFYPGANLSTLNNRTNAIQYLP